MRTSECTEDLYGLVQGTSAVGYQPQGSLRLES